MVCLTPGLTCEYLRWFISYHSTTQVVTFLNQVPNTLTAPLIPWYCLILGIRRKIIGSITGQLVLSTHTLKEKQFATYLANIHRSNTSLTELMIASCTISASFGKKYNSEAIHRASLSFVNVSPVLLPRPIANAIMALWRSEVKCGRHTSCLAASSWATNAQLLYIIDKHGGYSTSLNSCPTWRVQCSHTCSVRCALELSLYCFIGCSTCKLAAKVISRAEMVIKCMRWDGWNPTCTLLLRLGSFTSYEHSVRRTGFWNNNKSSTAWDSLWYSWSGPGLVTTRSQVPHPATTSRGTSYFIMSCFLVPSTFNNNQHSAWLPLY